MATRLIVDGYNLIRQSPSLREVESRGLQMGRETLIRQLASYKRARGHEITVVFDGWHSGSLTESQQWQRGILVIYSKRDERADEVIKRMAKRFRQGAVVVTSDREVAYFVETVGATAVSSEEFEGRMGIAVITEAKGMEPEEAGDDVRGKGTKKKGPARRPSKRRRRTIQRLKKL
ncbi:MAG: NYN domain-containing protein [Syntrophobacterales bacterium]|nr:MAG: NYN domain-containing protein [Syntrophobacterales bacterium]